MTPLLQARGLTHRFGRVPALDDVSLLLRRHEILAIVGESGSGKTTLLNVLSGRLAPQSGDVLFHDGSAALSLAARGEIAVRKLQRARWGYVAQDPRAALRLDITAGGNIGERLMASGARNYAEIRATASRWLEAVEIDPQRLDDLPRTFSGGMLQRLQIAATLVTDPELVFMDEPTGGLDVSVQARILDLIRSLVRRLGLAVLLVTHDIGVARLLADRLIVMRHGRIVEHGLTDQVLDDPHHEYTQLLVASVLPA
ncbi:MULTISPECIES: phosphonate C-P lyase system protein PhnK [Acidiphilium]|jgi:putative phosphonate transport system ATP-binding protein|uniref:Putative phosphonate transport system ATP-binding protein n=1 Tax=Acidiphilium rubrum TaxID=526 RepID=A0A8G2CHV1_ACIRU|nr:MULTISPECIES: phosphonate C-P lyase system protein PhnK [Acidiphilium]MBW4034155.1 phosphonate C-P lyase system protein PhnK [Pseudomonadota bacterium]SIQ10847.1 putative phosphonate transport system ATP-binding protein [Acidiphilium rubrum]